MSELIEPYLSHLRAGGRSPNTITSRAVILRRFDRDLPRGLDDAATHELAQILGRFKNRWTLYTYRNTLTDFYRFATRGRDPYLDWDPTEDLIKPRGPRCHPDPVTDEEMAAALAGSNPWWRMVILFGAKAGLRASEIAALRWSHVTKDVIYVRQAKGGDPQSVETNAELWALRSADTGPILGVALTGAQLSHRARRHFNRIGLPKVHLHRFRHYFGTTLVRAGVDLRTVQELMRHRNLASTQGYTLITSGQRRAAVNALPVLTESINHVDGFNPSITHPKAGAAPAGV